MATSFGITKAPMEHHGEQWSPYVDNGGSCACYCGRDFAVICADTRLNLDYSIQTRDSPRLFQLTPTCALSAGGMQADVAALVRTLRGRAAWYKFQNGREMSTRALANLLSCTLYSKRFFPYSAQCVLAGIDADGSGVCFEYDAVGSYQALPYASNGSARTLMEPFLDSQVNPQHQSIQERPSGKDIPLADAKALLREALTVGTERDIHTGDWLDMWVITAAGIQRERVPLKFD